MGKIQALESLENCPWNKCWNGWTDRQLDVTHLLPFWHQPATCIYTISVDRILTLQLSSTVITSFLSELKSLSHVRLFICSIKYGKKGENDI